MSGPLTLLYHDVLEEGGAASGPTGPGAERFKIPLALFLRHVEAIGERAPDGPAVIGAGAASGPGAGGGPASAAGPSAGELYLTFDDGGAASRTAARVLEDRGWRGHFFVATGWIGEPGFLDEGGIRELHDRGHRIGTHSVSHPRRISALEPGEIRREWAESVDRLSRILGERVRVGSVPGGYYSRAVAEGAARAGITTLFTSEPTTRTRDVDGCTVAGRYSVTRATPPQTVGRLAAGGRLPLWRQLAAWKLKRGTKRLLGTPYFRYRERLLALLGGGE